MNIKRLAQVTGFGVGASLFVCCVLPIGVSALAGGAIAASFAALDNLWTISGSALVFGAAAWWILERKSAVEAEGCECVDVCSLPDAERGQRSELIRRELVPHVRKAQTLADGLRFEFESEPAIRTQLEDFVAFERECCSGLEFQLVESDPHTLRLTIRGPGAELFEPLKGPTYRPTKSRSISPNAAASVDPDVERP